MILLTIGTQLPFDRLIKAVDAFSQTHDEPVFGQIGKTAKYQPANFEYCETMRPSEFEEKFRAARVIVSHAGIGTILSARKHGKPIVIVPRLARFGEHRNDHQLATCAQLGQKPGIYVVDDPADIGTVLTLPELEPQIPAETSPDRIKLLDGIRRFVHGERVA